MIFKIKVINNTIRPFLKVRAALSKLSTGKLSLRILNEMDGYNYRIEDFFNRVFKSDTDYLYRQYIEACIEELRMIVIDPKGYVEWFTKRYL